MLRRRRHVAEHHLRKGGSRARSSWTRRRSSSSRISVAANGDGAVPSRHPIARRLLHVLQRRRPVRHLLRRQPPALRRQRRQGDGVGQGRLSARWSSSSRSELAALDPLRQAERDRDWAALTARLDDRAERPRRRRRAAHADDRRGDRQGAGGGAALPAGTVLPAAEFRIGGAARRVRRPVDSAADGRHRADRRVGRQGTRAAVDDRARAGRVEPARAPT